MKMNIRKHPIPEFITLNKLGDTTLVRVRQSHRSKRIAIRIEDYQRVELIMPFGHFQKAQDFLLGKESWVREKLKSLERQIINNSDGLVIFNVDYTLEYIDSKDEKVQFCDNKITVYSAIDNRAKTLRNFLTNFLFSKISQIVHDIRDKWNLQWPAIRISNNKSTWGSCSSKGMLSFNRRLIFAPLEILYYVIVHEMCHLVEMNHSARFWHLVSNLCPDYKVHKQWLKENSFRLHHYSNNLDGS